MKFNKILAGILACCFVGGALLSVAMPADNTVITASAYTGAVLTYTNHGDHIGIFHCDESATSVVIPDKIDGLPVTSIDGYAFIWHESLTEITIPDSVISIGDMAFCGCDKLTSITIPDSVTSIGEWAFDGTPWLEAKQAENPLVIVNGILIDGTTCSGDVVIPDSVTSICDSAFATCSGLTGITILNPNCEIGDSNTTISNGWNEDWVPYFNGTIYGYENSTAQAYAEKYNKKFIALSSDPEIAMGDVNGDNTIDSSDATDVLVDYSLTSTGKASQLTDAQKAAADVDNDGKIDSSDASFILQYYAYSSTGGKETDMSKWMTND